jgi:S-formylglutathione hydrolase FrmB
VAKENARVTRRALVIGAGVAGLSAIGVGFATGSGGFDVPTERKITAVPPRIEQVRSRHRGRTVDLVTFLPTATPPADLPVCLLLHGRHGTARRSALPGMTQRLANTVASGAVPPFAFVAVDGGDNYWHEVHPGDDPMAMLLDEMPGWLAERGLRRTPFACAGVSMGGFGALLYARRRNERHNPVQAAAAISPGLLLSWQEMNTRGAFRDATQWAELDPLRNVPTLGSTPTGIWCGKNDHFITGARRFVQLAHPEAAYTGPGGHDPAFFGSCVPSLIAFLGTHLRSN